MEKVDEIKDAQLRGIEYANETLTFAYLCCDNRDEILAFIDGVRVKLDLIFREVREA